MSHPPSWNEPIADSKRCRVCGNIVGKEDVMCRGCGAEVSSTNDSDSMELLIESSQQVDNRDTGYDRDRRFSLFERLFKLLSSPRETMTDIALNPDYGGPIVIMLLNSIGGVFAISVVFQKFQFTGPYADQILTLSNAMLAFTIFFLPILMVIRWIVKSTLVYVLSDGGNNWDFKLAASITGYSYTPSILLGLVGVLVAWIFLPTITIHTGNLEAAVILLENQAAFLTWYRFSVTIPLTLLGLFWKSYLGGIGINEGTEGKTQREKGTIIFLFIGLVGLVLDYIL